MVLVLFFVARYLRLRGRPRVEAAAVCNHARGDVRLTLRRIAPIAEGA